MWTFVNRGRFEPGTEPAGRPATRRAAHLAQRALRRGRQTPRRGRGALANQALVHRSLILASFKVANDFTEISENIDDNIIFCFLFFSRACCKDSGDAKVCTEVMYVHLLKSRVVFSAPESV